MRILKYSMLLVSIILSTIVKAQQVEIRYQGQDTIWLAEQHHFVWDKLIPLHFEGGKAVYEVSRVPKVFRLASTSGFSSYFFVGKKSDVVVSVLSTNPLNIKVENDFAGTYFYEVDAIASEYTKKKLELADDYMKLWQEKDFSALSLISNKLEKLKSQRNSAFRNVVDRASKEGCLEDFLVCANMPLSLKYEIIQQQNKSGKVERAMLEELDLYSEIYTPAYVYYSCFYPFVLGEQMNLRVAQGENRAKLMREVNRNLQQEFYNTLCNRMGEIGTMKDLIDHVWSIPNFDRCVGIHMEFDEQTKRDTALNKFSGRMERMYMTRSGKVMGNFSSKTPEGKKVSLADYRGKYVLLDFWASWCGPCRGLMPKMKKLYEKYHATGKFDILGVSKDEDRGKWLKALEEEGMAWNNILAQEASLEDPSQFESVTGLPQMVVVDPEGNIVLSVSGSDNMERVIETLERALGK